MLLLGAALALCNFLPVMKTRALVTMALLACQSLAEEKLSEPERDALLERLEIIRNSADARVDARFRAAISAYTSAIASEESVREFYLKCVEKVNFTDQNRKASEFREWKRQEAEKLSSQGLGLALQIQLRWLILTLQAASENSDRQQLASNAQSVLNTIVARASELAAHRDVIARAASASVFARAYEITDAGTKDWPSSPGDIGAVYEQIIFPPLRAGRQTDTLRAAWTLRIQQEMTIQENSPPEQAPARRIGMASAMRPASYELFLAEELPQLQWTMELDLYKHGDPRNAAARMLAHIEKNITHKTARTWSEQLEELLTPAAPLEASIP
jgi:hypothetical protein